MRAQVHNDAAGWDDLADAPFASSEPADPTLIKGNFTREELPPPLGFTLPIALGHTSDYNGYTVSYREYMARDHYRKALTSYGPHTADHMNSQLVAIASALKGGPGRAPSPLDPLAAIDEVRQEANAIAIGRASSTALDAWEAALPEDLGPVAPLAQPTGITRFQAATFSWRGGSTAVDNPSVRVERLARSSWVPYARQAGEVPTMVALPHGAEGTVDAWTASHEWRWTAAFEAFDAFPRTVVDGGQVPDGTYRFVVDGVSSTAGERVPYHLESTPFRVSRWLGVTASGPRLEAGGDVSFEATADYPRTYASPFPYVQDDGGTVLCRTCAFRPWAAEGEVERARVTVDGPNGIRRVLAVRQGDRWVADTNLVPGERARIAIGHLVDEFGERNGHAIWLWSL
jgi:hypothetical protein